MRTLVQACPISIGYSAMSDNGQYVNSPSVPLRHTPAGQHAFRHIEAGGSSPRGALARVRKHPQAFSLISTFP